MKAALRKTAARTVATLIDAIGPALRSVTASDAASYMRDSGYAARPS